ncbi:MAG: hypothetical protein M1823_007538, partial [Watsoniomyces obsoletus]
MELKKASNHPFMFPSAEDRLVPVGARREEVLRALVTSSGKLMLLDQLLWAPVFSCVFFTFIHTLQVCFCWHLQEQHIASSRCTLGIQVVGHLLVT